MGACVPEHGDPQRPGGNQADGVHGTALGQTGDAHGTEEMAGVTAGPVWTSGGQGGPSDPGRSSSVLFQGLPPAAAASTESRLGHGTRLAREESSERRDGGPARCPHPHRPLRGLAPWQCRELHPGVLTRMHLAAPTPLPRLPDGQLAEAVDWALWGTFRNCQRGRASWTTFPKLRTGGFRGKRGVAPSCPHQHTRVRAHTHTSLHSLPFTPAPKPALTPLSFATLEPVS